VIDIMLVKTTDGLIPASEEDRAIVDNLKIGQEFGCTFTTLRSGKFHRLLFALITFGYNNSDRINIEHKGQVVGQSFKNYRDGLVIRAGHHHIDVSANGKTLTYRAQSLSYTECTQELVEQIYSDILDVLCADFTNYTKDDLDKLVKELIRFA
jgi:hypothetical protein